MTPQQEADQALRRFPKLRYPRRHWRVVRSEGFSFHASAIPFFVEYRSILGIWRRVRNPEWIGWVGFSSNEAAVAWIQAQEPRSIIESPDPAMAKPKHWNDRELASGRYGLRAEVDAKLRLAAAGDENVHAG